MSENVKEEKKSLKTIVILLIIVIVLLLAAGIVAAAFIMKKDADLPGQGDNGGLIQYEAHVVNYEDAQQVYDEMQERADNTVGVKYSNNAFSDDGTNFICKIENPVRNELDMYLNIYKDETMTEQILLTGLIPAGSGIEEFKSEIPLEPGTYKSVLVMTLVEDDHSTLHGQTKVILNLNVGEE